MGKAVLALLVLVALFTLVLDCEISRKNLSHHHRIKRQSLAPVPFMNPPIPTSIGHYIGGGQELDQCPRDKILVEGSCHRALTQGPCTLQEQVLLDPNTRQGYCAPRLCPPDRIFVFSDQLCHDPRNTMLCPPGRQLYITAYGTPVCQCPDGTYEGDDDLDDDVCDPLLGRTLSCPPNQVLWFRDFSLPPECLPDPCGGENLNRGPNDLPFVPSATNGTCYQLGQMGGMGGVCPAKTWYSLALESLRGECTDLNDAGYQVFDEQTLKFFTEFYGPPIPREATANLPTQLPATPQRPVSPLSPTLQSPLSPLSPQPPLSPLSPQPPLSPLSPQPPLSPLSPQPPLSPLSPQPPLSPLSPQPPLSPLSPQPPLSPLSPQPPLSPLSPQPPLSPLSPMSPQPPLSPLSPQPPLSPLSPQPPLSPQLPQSSLTPQSPLSPLSPQSPQTPTLQAQVPVVMQGSSGDQIPTSQAGVSTTGQGFTGQTTSQAGQGFTGQTGTSSTGQGFTGQSGITSTGQGSPGQTTGQSEQGFTGQSGTSSTGQGFPGQTTGQSVQGFTGQSGTSGQGFTGQSGTSGQGFTGQSGTSGQGFTGQSETSGQGFTGQSGASGQNFGQSGGSISGQGFSGQSSMSNTGQSGFSTTGQGSGQSGFTSTSQRIPGQSSSSGQFSSQSGTSTSGQGFTSQSGMANNGQTFSGQSGRPTTKVPSHITVTSTGQRFSGQSGASPIGQRVPTQSGTGQRFAGQSGTSSTGQRFSGQSGTSSTGQRIPGQSGMSSTGQQFSGQSGMSSTGQRFSGQSGHIMSGRPGQPSTVGQPGSRVTAPAVSTPVSQANPFLNPRLPQTTTSQMPHRNIAPTRTQMQPHMSPTVHPQTTHMTDAFGNPKFNPNVFNPNAFNPNAFFYSNEQESLEIFEESGFMSLARSISARQQAQNQFHARQQAQSQFHARPQAQSQFHARPQAKAVMGHGSRPSLDVRQGHLLTKVTGLVDSGPAQTPDLSYLQKPTNHELHSFYKGVSTLMSGVLGGQGHHRGRRSPLPHATPGNVFETRLVGCRAGAVRDINAKCRDTILPARAPVKRSTRTVPPVPPSPGCPDGQAYNLRRMCEPRSNAVGSINAFNLG